MFFALFYNHFRVHGQHGINHPAVILVFGPVNRRRTDPLRHKSVVDTIMGQISGTQYPGVQPELGYRFCSRPADVKGDVRRWHAHGNDLDIPAEIFQERKLQLNGIVRLTLAGRFHLKGKMSGKFTGQISMDGDIAKLPEIVELAEKYNAVVMSDDAHALGVLGPNGEGTPAHFGLTDRVEIIMATFSKSLASVGGFVAASRDIINYLQHHSRALIFSASPPPAAVAAAKKALEIIKTEPWRRERLWEITRFMQKEIKGMGYDIGVSETPIIPIIVGDFLTVLKMNKMLEDEGVFVNPVVPPAVQPNQSLIRLSFMATHTDEDLEFALEKLRKVGKALGII